MAHGHRISVQDPHPDGAPFDYADAFEVARDPLDHRTAEECLRAAIGRTRGGAAVLAIHRHVLRFRLGPWISPDSVLGWTLRSVEPDRVHLAATGPLMSGALVVRLVAGTARVTTYVTYHQRRRATAVWRAVSPLHRAIAPRLLENASRYTHDPVPV